MPLFQTFRSLFLRVPPATSEPTPMPSAERRWPPPPPRAQAVALTRGEADWDTVPTAPPAACHDSILNADEPTLDRDTVDAGPRPTTEIAPPPGPWPEHEVSVHGAAPRSSPSAGSPVRRPARSIHDSVRRVATPSSASIPASFPDHSAAAGAVWPDDEDQAAVSRPGSEISKAEAVRGGSALASPASSRRARANPLALTGELPIARFDY